MSDILMESRLANAVWKLASARHPSVEKILRSHGYQYEANLIHGVIYAYEKELDWPKPSKKESKVGRSAD